MALGFEFGEALVDDRESSIKSFFDALKELDFLLNGDGGEVHHHALSDHVASPSGVLAVVTIIMTAVALGLLFLCACAVVVTVSMAALTLGLLFYLFFSLFFTHFLFASVCLLWKWSRW
jgi:hypothetical protein